ncbi:MAG: cation:proton antiporter [Nitrospinae bacterium]|nr:cation:proton antiporter [Nitrospinota bacterium]MBL7020132.1 cation:proton antiporter [Nitrospinaceae bacterium]
MVHLIEDLAVLLLVSLPINLFFHKIKLPSVMGYLLAGVLIGPYGLKLISDVATVKELAELGVILLLFVIGLEFSLGRLLKNLASVLGVGGLQLGLTTAFVWFVFREMGFQQNQSIAFGLIIALSSTAIVLKMITDRAEIDTLHGKLCIGTLLFQDLCVVPIMLLLPLLAQSGVNSGADFAFAMVKSLAAVAAIFFLSKLIVPKTLAWISRVGNKEHLTLSVLFIILATGWVSQKMGLTLAMGALIAGMIISESEYNHQIILDILPLRDYFSSIFFISVGMLLQTQVLADSVWTCLGLFVLVVLVKGGLAGLACLLVRVPMRISFVVGMRLAQVGEFSLILSAMALDQGLFDSHQYQLLLIVSILSMLFAPLLIQASSALSMKLFSRWKLAETDSSQKPALKGHVIIVGYSLGGRTLAQVLLETQIPFMVLDLNGEQVKRALTEGISTHYGDCAQEETLRRAGLKEAKMIVFSIPDYTVTEKSVRLARKINPEVKIMVRTRLTAQVEELKTAGADEVIPEEFETSIEIFSRVLRDYHIPNNIIEQQVELIRLEGYSMFRGLSLNSESLKKFSTYLTATLTESYLVLQESWAREKLLGHINITDRTGAVVIAVVRKNKPHPNPGSEFAILSGDILILFGSHQQLDRSITYLKSGQEPNLSVNIIE